MAPAREGRRPWVWVAVALGCLLPARPCAASVHSSFGDNSGMLTGESANVDYDAMTETVVRLATDTTTLSATLPPYFQRAATAPPATTTSSTPPPPSPPPPPRFHAAPSTTPEPPRIDVDRLGSATRVLVECHATSGGASISSSTGITAPVTAAPAAGAAAGSTAQPEAATVEGEAEVDLSAVEVGEESTVVAVEARNCGRMGVVGALPDWASTLTVSAPGTLALAPGWSAVATELWMRAAGGLEHKGDLCALMPPTLRFLDASRTRLGELVVASACAPLRRVEAAHSGLSRVSLCTPALVTLHVSGNEVSGGLEWAACAGGVAAVELLQANHNELKSASTCGWPSLHTLDLRHNRLAALDLTSCPPTNLTRITAARNLLQTPPELTPTLLHVDLSRNSLTELPALTPALLTADFSHNGIAEVGKHRFKRARKLLHLKLAHNHLTQLHAHDLSGLRELLTLDVSHNRLREVSAGSFRHLRHLQRLHLQHNLLTTLDARDLAALTPHTHAILHHNPWACTCSLLTALQQLQNCATCQHQIVGVECKERGEWVAARAVLHSCRQAVKDVTQRLQDESDEDLSEEDPADDPLRGSGDDGEGAVMVVPGLVVLLVAAVAVALGYRLYRKHRRNVRATLAPFCCGCCGTVPPVTTLGNNHHHSLQHRHLPNADNDSDTETEL